jgi:hypothetical protein
LQTVPAARGTCDGAPLLQRAVVHWLPSSAGRSASSFTTTTPPEELQTLFLQLPSVCPPTTFPAGSFATPQNPFRQVRFAHAPS